MGGVFDDIRHTRNKYHYAVRLAKRETDRLRSQTLREAADTCNLALFNDMKNCFYSRRCSQHIPDELEGEVPFKGIIEKFRKCYRTLYNSVHTSAEMFAIKIDIDKIIEDNISISVTEVFKITPGVVKDAVQLMKPSKQM